MATTVVIVHYIVCVILILVILLQAGKGADIGAVFGGGASQTVFGGRGPATFLNKMTAIVAVLFMVTSISLAHVAKKKESRSVIETSTSGQQLDLKIDKTNTGAQEGKSEGQ